MQVYLNLQGKVHEYYTDLFAALNEFEYMIYIAERYLTLDDNFYASVRSFNLKWPVKFGPGFFASVEKLLKKLEKANVSEVKCSVTIEP